MNWHHCVDCRSKFHEPGSRRLYASRISVPLEASPIPASEYFEWQRVSCGRRPKALLSHRGSQSPSLTPWLSRSRFADGQTSAGLGLGRVEGWSNHEVSLPSLPPYPSSFRASCERHLRENREQRRPAVFCLYVYRVSRPVDDKGWRPGMTRAGGRREAGLTQCADDMMRSCAHENPARCRRSPLQAPGVWGWNPHNRHLSG